MNTLISEFPYVMMISCAALASCDGGARDMDDTYSRGINSDIAAVRGHGPTALDPGDTFATDCEPLGVFPWQINENR